MPEWWTYSFSDFVMYSSRTYLRLVESHNQSLWPMQSVALAAGVLVIWLVASGDQRRYRVAVGLVAGACVFVAMSWFHARLSTIHTYAGWFAWAFGAEALLLAWFALRDDAGDRSDGRVARGWLAAVAVLGYPAAGLLFGRTVHQVELAGLMPIPTALATLALVRGRSLIGWAAAVVPLTWLAFDGMTLRAMEMREAWLLLIFVIIVVVTGVVADTLAGNLRVGLKTWPER